VSEEKRFDPTPSRLARARREGDRPRSQDAGAVAALGAGAIVLAATLGPLSAACRRAFIDATATATATATAIATAPAGPAAGLAAFGGGPYLVVAGCALGVASGALAGAVLVAMAQGGGLAFVMPSPRLAKLDPVAGLKRMFSRDAALAGAKALLVAGAVGLAIAAPVRETFARAQLGASAAQTASLATHALAGVAASALAVAAAFACGDVALERAKWRRRLRMSLEELKRDRRQNDGDPLLRGRRRQAHRNLVRGAIARVAEAAFVVANPTHVAVALEYRPPDVAVPRVLVRARDAGALEVRRRANALGIPVVENVELARSLFATCGAGEYIPAAAYAAVAAIVAALLRAGTLK
jgi:flagellar biosynthesis protein FlhB